LKKKKLLKIFILIFSVMIIFVSVGSVINAATTNETSETEQIQEEEPQGEPPEGMPPGDMPFGGADTMTYDYTGELSGVITADGEEVTASNNTYETSTIDENVALVQNAGTLTIKDATLNKSGDDTNGDNCNFYGINSILLSVNSDSIAHISNSSLNADSQGSNGIFATDNATVYAINSSINTTAANSRGLDATYGGTIIASYMDISTEGDHCATIATDRGGGEISVTDASLSTQGSGSPLIYSTGNIQVNKVEGTSTGSQIAGMEGLNTVSIYNSNLTSEMTTATASDPVANGIIIYQSTSGDAEAATGETATFEAFNSRLSSEITSGSMFYLTNTEANIILNNTTLDFDSDNVNLLAIQGNDSNNWGTAGSNGANVSFTGLGETLSGDIDVDTISSLDMYLLEGTTYTGATAILVNEVNTDTTESPITMNLDSNSKWIVTDDSTITNLNAELGSSIVDEDGNTVSIIVDGTIVESGTSSISVTVTGSYSTSVTTDSSNQLSSSYIDRSGFDEYYSVDTSYSEQ
jgi:hypothetical protein